MNKRLRDQFLKFFHSPKSSQNHWQRLLVRSYLLVWYCWRQLRRHRAEGMAAELTYRTVFSLFPVLVLGLVIFRVFGGLAEFQNRVEYQLYDFFGVPDSVPEAYFQPAPIDSGFQSPTDIQQENNSTDSNLSSNVTLTPLAGQSQASPSPNVTTNQATSVNETDLSSRQSQRPSFSVQRIDSPDEQVSEIGVTAKGQADENEASAGAPFDLSPADSIASETSATQRPETGTGDIARSSIRRRMQEVTRIVSAIDFRSVGVFGLLLFVYAAVALANTAEHLFNRIYEAESQRPFHLRLAIHWSIITLGSGLLAMSLSMSAEVIEWSGTVGVNSATRRILSHFLSLTASWVLLFLLYALMPNTKVALKSAATGSLAGALLWEAGKYGFQIYVIKAVPYSTIYGSIGLLPLFLFWIYLTWWIVLFGLILTHTLQTIGGRSPQELIKQDLTPRQMEADWMLPMMIEIAEGFARGCTLPMQALAAKMGLSNRDTTALANTLVEANLLQYLEGTEKRVTLNRPADSILVKDVLTLADRSRSAKSHAAWLRLESHRGSSQVADAKLHLSDLMETQDA
ncbi:YihY/virulence factor BrkB family protein [bacterium]|nr:YihY/virulence factor BrkB family protein [bacterium]